MKAHVETNGRAETRTCWQREGPCACLRVEVSGSEIHIFPYQHLVTASLIHKEGAEVLRLAFSSHDVEISGLNLRSLLLALQEFAVKWVRVMPHRYHQLEAAESGVVSIIKLQETK